MRIRNIKNAKEIINNSELVITNNIFKDDKPLYIEIGCGKGNFIIETAKRNPNINFIGIERYESILLRAIKKVENIPSNLRFMCIDAKEIYLNFSDPWPKKRHSKRRLTSDSFLNLYNKISKNNINIKMKTDNKDLFAYSIMTYNNYGFKIKDISLDLPEDYENNVVTEYERKFRNQGITINYINVVKEVKYEE